MTDQIGQLRSLMHATNRDWPAILALLEQWNNLQEFYTVAMPYCHDLCKQDQSNTPRYATTNMFGLILGRAQNGQPDERALAAMSLCTDIYTSTQWPAYNLDKFASPLTQRPQPQPMFWFERHSISLQLNMSTIIEYMTQHDMPRLHSLALSTPSGWQDVEEETAELAAMLGKASWSKDTLNSISLQLHSKDMIAFATHANLSGIQTLSFNGNDLYFDSGALQTLLDAMSSDALRTLNLMGGNITDDQAVTIAKHPSMANLTHIDIRYNMGLSSRGIECLRRSKIIPKTTLAQIEDQYDEIFE